jgi:hypothetical protein
MQLQLSFYLSSGMLHLGNAPFDVKQWLRLSIARVRTAGVDPKRLRLQLFLGKKFIAFN